MARILSGIQTYEEFDHLLIVLVIFFLLAIGPAEKPEMVLSFSDFETTTVFWQKTFCTHCLRILTKIPPESKLLNSAKEAPNDAKTVLMQRSKKNEKTILKYFNLIKNNK